MLQKYHYDFQTCLTYFDLIDTIFTISLWEEFFMKGLKAILGITLAATTIGGAAAFAATRNLNSLQKAKATPATNTRRIWIINNDNWWTENTFYVYAWRGDLAEATPYSSDPVTSVLSDYYHGLLYADIEYDSATTDLKVIVRYSGTEWGDYNQTVTLSLGTLGTADTIYLNSGSTQNPDANNKLSRNASIGVTNGFSGEQLAVIMSKYNTCSSASSNGYNAFPQLKTNFFDNTNPGAFDAKVYGQDKYTCRDYADAMRDRSGYTE